jgi:hypothetical protein
MAEKPVESERATRRSRRAPLAALAALPALVAAGALAPQLLQVALQSWSFSGSQAQPQEPPGPFEHQPLPAPRDPALGFTPVALELDRLFFQTEFRGVEPVPDGGAVFEGAGAGPSPAEIAELSTFPRSETEAIVLDELDPHQEPLVFEDALVPEEIAEALLPDQEDLFLPLCNTIPATNCIRFDDFTTVREQDAVPIPEPAVLALVAAGLAWLAAGSRRRRES